MYYWDTCAEATQDQNMLRKDKKQLLILDFTNDYPDDHKLEVILFKSDKAAIASLSDSLKKQKVLLEASTRLLLTNTKHRENIIIIKSSSVTHLKPTAKDKQRKFILK